MSELFLLLDQLLGLAWIFPTLHRNYVSIQRPQKPCLRKQLRAARRQSASLIIDNSNRRGHTFKLLRPLPPTDFLLLFIIIVACIPLCLTVLGTKDTKDRH
jgi:hypothetical protein